MEQPLNDEHFMRLALAEAQLVSRRPTEAMNTARGVLKRAETSVTAMKLLARAYLAMEQIWESGEIGKHTCLRNRCLRAWGFESLLSYQNQSCAACSASE